MFGKKEKSAPVEHDIDVESDNAAPPEKSFWSRLWPVLACGSGLFSEGYVNNVIGSVNTTLIKIYPAYADSVAYSNVSSIAFAGTVVGMLIFGYTSDHWSRKNSLLISTIILMVFTALSAGAYGAGGSQGGLFAALTAYRFFTGIGIGGEYPAGSVACSEATGELKSGTRNRWFILFTNTMIDWGFVIGAFVPYICVLIFTTDHLRAAWRTMLGIGVIPPLALFLIRLRLEEPEEFKRESMRHCKVPYGLVVKYYWKRWLVVAAIWFLYDFSSFSFGIYSSTIVDTIGGTDQSLAQSFGWNTVINLFYIPGAMFGSLWSDWLGPKWALITGVVAQAVAGYLMAGLYDQLKAHIAGFCVLYGIFLSLGEVGPGDNIGLIASKTSSTAIRGQYYGTAAAVGKIGAFVGTYVFPYIEKAGGDNTTASVQYPFWVSSSLCILTAAIAFFFLPHIGQDTITTEDAKFRDYLESKGWDTRQMGFNTLLNGESAVSHESPVFEQTDNVEKS